jgi:hypothetical protein
MNERMQDRALQCEAFTADTGTGLRTVKLAGWGSVQSSHGTFVVDDVAAQETISAFDAQAVQVPIDIEHSVLNENLPPEQRGAIGWVTKIFAEAGRGLFALVKWSEKATGLIRSGAFQYLSPTFLVRKTDRRVVGLHSAALTTKPALVNADLLAASQNAGTETKAPADENAAIAQSVRSVLGLREDADADLVVASVTTLKARTAGVAALETELSALKVQVHNHELEQWLAPYSAKGVVGWGGNEADRKADREMILRMASSNREDCERVLRQRITFMPPQGRTNPPTGRQTTIIEAEREFKGNPAHARSTSLQAFVANALREKGLPKLTEAETSELSIG